MSQNYELPGLDGKVALITGAAHGMGRSHAVELARCGVDTILVDLESDPPNARYPMGNAAELEETARMVEAEGRRAHVAVADVRDFAALEAAVAAGVMKLGRLDIVVANAGVVVQEQDVAGWEVSEERWDFVVDIDLKGVWHTVKASAPWLVEAGNGGSIVLVSSTAGLKGMVEIPDYAAAKHGVVGLMKTFAQELAGAEVRVNAVHPGGVMTPMTTNEMMTSKLEASPELQSHFAGILPVEVMDPVDISNAVLFLASDAARYVTGISLPVDAGYAVK